MTHRARHAVASQRLERTAALLAVLQEHSPVATGRLRRLLRSRHMACCALVLDLGAQRGMVEDLSADAGEDVRISGGVGHDRSAPAGANRYIFTGWRDQVVVTSETLTRYREHR